ncbi:MAG TPA: SDR family oxidoreductase [Longimicrobiaceae bacterium]|nr:SDR family oxidoreductase [Longimicrobiaceae bacterium]
MRDEVVLITGGSSGIGLATAEAFARRGARVWLTARGEEKLARAAASLSRPVHTLPTDVEDQGSLDRLAATIREREGRLDVLVNSAGQLDLASADRGALEIAERLMRVNYLGLARTVATTLPLLRLGSRRSIVNLSSFVGRLVPPYWSAYAASKHAVQAYSHALRQELRREGFHVALVLPGPVLSPMTENLLRTPMYPVPVGVPVLPPDRVAEAILRCVFRRRVEVTVPGRFGPLLRLASAFPTLVDLLYRRYPS